MPVQVRRRPNEVSATIAIDLFLLLQYLLGATMFALSMNVDWYLGDAEGGPSEPDILSLTAMFFFLNFLAATQVSTKSICPWM